jgi:hypothetical protein
VKVRYLGGDGASLGEDTLERVEIRRGERTYLHVRTAR